MPRVSVIMIFRDAAAYINEAVESVRLQTLSDWELILVDDGSTDGSTALAVQWVEREPARIRYLHHEGHANLGMSASRNAGVAGARGEYVAFLDADDVYLAHRLEEHVALLDEHPAVAAVQGRLWYWHGWHGGAGTAEDVAEAPPMGDFQGIVEAPVLLRLLLASRGATAPGICSLTIRKALFKQLGGCDPSFRDLFEDQVLWAKLYLEHPVWVSSAVLARYRQHPDSSTARAGGAAALERARVRHLQWLSDHLTRKGPPHAALLREVERALWEYRHPVLWQLRRLPRRVLSMAIRLARVALPTTVSQALARRWTSFKGHLHRQRLEAARARAGVRRG
ncbi:MAG: glycosyltransferase family 2 protein [Steroidobacteraceae bacterium]